MNTALEHFYTITAINPRDLAYDGMRPNPIRVGFCPVDIHNYRPRLAEAKSVSIEQEAYIEKAVKYAREQLQEFQDYIEVSIEDVVKVVVDSIKAAWNDMMNNGHTAGGMVELTLAAGAGLVSGILIAADKTGISIIGFAGLGAGAVAQAAIVVGGFIYPNTRKGLEGWGGGFNASAALLVGLEWEAMFTGEKVGHAVAVTGGVGLALSVEFQHAWLIDEKHL